MVLTERVELDGSLDDLADVAVGAAVAFRRKSGEELGVALVAGGGLEESPQIAARRIARARSVEVHAERLEDLGRVALELFPFVRLDLARADLLPMRGLLWVERKGRHPRSPYMKLRSRQMYVLR